MFRLSDLPLDSAELTRSVMRPEAGACVTFEGWVRNHNEGQPVAALEYEAYGPLAEKEGQRILAEAVATFRGVTIAAVHRTGRLAIGDLAVVVAVSSPHRGAAFDACRYVIDELKARVPIWKKEHYVDGATQWINCATRGEHVDDERTKPSGA